MALPYVAYIQCAANNRIQSMVYWKLCILCSLIWVTVLGRWLLKMMEMSRHLHVSGHIFTKDEFLHEFVLCYNQLVVWHIDFRVSQLSWYSKTLSNQDLENILQVGKYFMIVYTPCGTNDALMIAWSHLSIVNAFGDICGKSYQSLFLLFYLDLDLANIHSLVLQLSYLSSS